MNGDLILEKVNNKDLQFRWHQHLAELQKALNRLNEIRSKGDRDPMKMEYYEAVLEYFEARDNERNFFWDYFVKQWPKPEKQETAEAL